MLLQVPLLFKQGQCHFISSLTSYYWFSSWNFLVKNKGDFKKLEVNGGFNLELKTIVSKVVGIIGQVVGCQDFIVSHGINQVSSYCPEYYSNYYIGYSPVFGLFFSPG